MPLIDRVREALRLFFLASAALCLVVPGARAADLVGSWDGEAGNDQGVLSYTLPIYTPPGPRGIRPSLSLSYNAARGGFALGGLSRIQRCAASFGIDGYAGALRVGPGDEFCLDGQRLIALVGRPGESGIDHVLARDNGTRLRASGGSVGEPTHWRLDQGDGSYARYGLDASSRQSDGRGTLAWLLAERCDAWGNCITYHHKNPDGVAPQIDAISWSVHRIDFEHRGQANHPRAWSGGQSFDRNALLSEIRFTTAGTLRQQIVLDYEHDSPLTAPRLTQVSRCDGTGNCLPPTRFEWSATGPTSGSGRPSIDLAIDIDHYQMVDITGDGLPEACAMGTGSPGGHSDDANLYCHGQDTSLIVGPTRIWNQDIKDYRDSLRFLDLDGDARLDYCYTGSRGTQCALNTGSGGGYDRFGPIAFWSDYSRKDNFQTTFGNIDTPSTTTLYKQHLIDVNFDRLPDHCVATEGSMDCTLQVAGEQWTGATVHTGLTQGAWRWQHWIDINADGRPDHCTMRGSSGMHCQLDKGEPDQRRFGPAQVWSTASFSKHYAERRATWQWVDINTDGLVDACFFHENHLWCQINTGTALDLAERVTTSAASSTSGWGGEPIELAARLSYLDINRDGRVDACGPISNSELRCAFGEPGYGSSGIALGKMQRFATLPGGASGTPFVRLADVNGDAQADICYRTDSGIRCATSDRSTPPTILESVTSAHKTVEFTYQWLHEDTDRIYLTDDRPPDVPGLVDIKPVRLLLDSLDTKGPSGDSAVMSYTYAGARLDPVHGVRSLASITQHIPGMHKRVTSRFHQSPALNGQLKQSTVWIGGVAFDLEQRKWQLLDVHGDQRVRTVVPASTSNAHFDLAGNIEWIKAVEYRDYDERAHAGQIVETSEVQIATNGPAVQVITTDNTWAHDPQKWHIGQLRDVTVTHSDGTSALSRRTRFEYNDKGASFSKRSPPMSPTDAPSAPPTIALATRKQSASRQ